MAEDSSPLADKGSDDLNLTGLIKALGSEESPAEAATKEAPSAFDPNATMDYQQAGMPFPELPFADSGSIKKSPQASREASKGTSLQTQTRSRSTQARSQTPRKSQGTGSRTPAHANKGGVPAGAKKTSTQAPKKSPAQAQRKTSAQASKKPTTQAPKKSSLQAPRQSPSQAPKQSPSQAPKQSPSQAPKLSPLQAPKQSPDPGRLPQVVSAFKPMDTSHPTYKIRGGGRRWGFLARSPVAIIAAVLFFAVGLGLVATAVNSFMGVFANTGSGTEFNLTKTQTREAIDGRMPLIINYVDLTIEETRQQLSDAGHFVFANDRYQPDSLDTGAVTSELVSMPQQMTNEQMAGYYEGGFNAYSPEELAEYFNGAFMLDLARGELGSWNKLRYVNFNATSLEDEMAHLADLQQLSGDTVTISAEGIDSRGNRVVQGQKVIDGERILYFKIAACLFKDVYNNKSLTADSVYITCTVATYDFFSGVDTITPA